MKNLRSKFCFMLLFVLLMAGYACQKEVIVYVEKESTEPDDPYTDLPLPVKSIIDELKVKQCAHFILEKHIALEFSESEYHFLNTNGDVMRITLIHKNENTDPWLIRAVQMWPIPNTEKDIVIYEMKEELTSGKLGRFEFPPYVGDEAGVAVFEIQVAKKSDVATQGWFHLDFYIQQSPYLNLYVLEMSDYNVIEPHVERATIKYKNGSIIDPSGDSEDVVIPVKVTELIDNYEVLLHDTLLTYLNVAMPERYGDCFLKIGKNETKEIRKLNFYFSANENADPTLDTDWVEISRGLQVPPEEPMEK